MEFKPPETLHNHLIRNCVPNFKAYIFPSFTTQILYKINLYFITTQICGVNQLVNNLCPVCGRSGTFMQKTSKTKTSTGEYKTYKYWYVYHGKESRKQWCYLNKRLLTLPEIQEAIQQATQTTTQISNDITQTSNYTQQTNNYTQH